MSPRVAHLPTRSPGRRQETFKSFKVSGDLGTREGVLVRSVGVECGSSGSSEFQQQAKVTAGVDHSTQWDSEDAKRAGFILSSPGNMTSQVSQESQVGVETASTAVQGRILDGVDVEIQAFEDNPLEGLLSRKEICSLIRIDDLVGSGIRENPEAIFDGHSISSKRVVDKGIVYQVVILKELYIQEKESVKVVEVSKKKAKKNVLQGKEQEVVEVIDLESEVQETPKASGSKVVVEIKEEKKEEKDVKVEEELLMFKEKPWANLRQKIIGKQVRQTPVPVPDTRTPYQIRTESPQEPNLCLLEINSHIRRAMEEIDEFLKGKTMATSSFLPLSLSKKITEQYSSFLKPRFDLDPELATQLEGLLAGVVFSGLNKRSVAVSTGELDKLA